LQEKIISLIAQMKGDPTVLHRLTGTSHLVDDLGLDSLQLINLVLLIEKELEVDIDFGAFRIEHLSSLDRFTEFVASLKRQ
jgi:acyl carrier protein